MPLTKFNVSDKTNRLEQKTAEALLGGGQESGKVFLRDIIFIPSITEKENRELPHLSSHINLVNRI